MAKRPSKTGSGLRAQLKSSLKSSLKSKLQNLFRGRSLLDLLFKSECGLCRCESHRPICDRCQLRLDQLQHPNRERFWRLSLPAFVWGEYRGELKQAIVAMKYKNRPQIGEQLGEYLGRAWMASPQRLEPIAVVPLPMHAEKRRDRGFDQAEAIAHGFCQVVGAPLLDRGLERVRRTQALFSLSPAERQRELERAFRPGADRAALAEIDRPVLLVDDILTTGATARAGEAALRSAGLRVCGIAAIATTSR